MSLQLQAIKLNHDSSSGTHDALNIRRDASSFVSVPEWTRGTSTKPEDAPAAYAIKPTRGNTLTIQAKFKNRSAQAKAVDIRAVDPTLNPKKPGGCAGFLVGLLRRLLRGLFGNVLGEVKARTVHLPPSGETGYITFDLQHSRLSKAGVGARTTMWQWQYRGSGGTWTDFETTRHRIYSVLDVPNEPWKQTPHSASNLQLPWTDVLDRAAVWAFLAQSTIKAATQVTEHIYHDVGGPRVEYDCPGGGASHYTNWGTGTFDCTAFLERISGGLGNGTYVNCTDCATFVTTFANALGCNLAASQMGWGFDLNPIQVIGRTNWTRGCPNWSHPGFNYHEVAWEPSYTENDHIYDACLAVDGDPDPTSSPHTFLLPTNMSFGSPGADYRNRLATPGTQASCAPQNTPKRRPVT